MNTTRTIEITAKTEEEARGIANAELNDNEVVVSSEVLSAPARGIFGFVGKQEFKIRFAIGEKPAPVIAEKAIEHRAPRDVDAAPPRNVTRDDRVSSERESESRQRQPRRSGRSDTRSRGRGQGRDFREDSEADVAEEIHLPDRPREPVTEAIKNNPGYQEIFDLIKDVAANVGIEDLTMNDFVRDGAWVIEASGENVSQLIGKRGRTLDSLQYLMNIIFNKGNDDRTKIVLDAQGYREKRYRNLMMLANRMCKKAVASRRSVELEPMSTLDRRTIHMALKDRTDIETFSKGTEPMRRVVISPIKKKKSNSNADWQPLTDENDSDFSEKFENSGAVPMFMEEDV